jgi:hypothetical protein
MKSIIEASSSTCRSRSSRDENQAARLLADLLDERRQEQVADGEDPGRDDAADESHGAALLEDVAAEAAEAGHRVGDVDLEVVLELLFKGRQSNAIAIVSSCMNRFMSTGDRSPRHG